MNHFLSCAALGLSLLASALPSAAEDRPGSFDFYVLSLSWSPTFCTGGRAKENPQQCAADKDFRFIVHGLWPQREKGYPDFCEITGQDRVPRRAPQVRHVTSRVAGPRCRHGTPGRRR